MLFSDKSSVNVTVYMVPLDWALLSCMVSLDWKWCHWNRYWCMTSHCIVCKFANGNTFNVYVFSFKSLNQQRDETRLILLIWKELFCCHRYWHCHIKRDDAVCLLTLRSRKLDLVLLPQGTSGSNTIVRATNRVVCKKPHSLRLLILLQWNK